MLALGLKPRSSKFPDRHFDQSAAELAHVDLLVDGGAPDRACTLIRGAVQLQPGRPVRTQLHDNHLDPERAQGHAPFITVAHHVERRARVGR